KDTNYLPLYQFFTKKPLLCRIYSSHLEVYLKRTVLKILSTRVDLEKHLRSIKEQGKSIGLVPTMGALHAGHIALVTFLREQCDVLVCSIFVNPTQFNNPEDLERYPRTLEADLAMLSAARCDVVFTPSVDEMYGVKEHWHIDLQGLDN